MDGGVPLDSLGPGGIPGSQEEMQQRQAQQKQMEEQRLSILDQILDTAAKDRLQRLNLVRKDKARQIEDSLIKAATTGQLRGKITDEALIGMLDGAAAEGAPKKVAIQRTKYNMDSDSDDNDDDLM
jgi:DNA-binding TFAR19-related protein (PDSD5 family)